MIGHFWCVETALHQQTSWRFHCRADSRFAPSQWETSLQSNTISHWLGTSLEPPLHCDYNIRWIIYHVTHIYQIMFKGVWKVWKQFTSLSLVGLPSHADKTLLPWILIKCLFSDWVSKHDCQQRGNALVDRHKGKILNSTLTQQGWREIPHLKSFNLFHNCTWPLSS